MWRGLLIIISWILIPAGCSFAQTYNETLTITTYYPSPYGVYRNLKLNPSPLPVLGVSPGVMYYDTNWGGVIRYFNNTDWVNLTQSPGPSCHLVPYGTTGLTSCPAGFYTWSGLANASGGTMLCCTVDNPI